MFPHDKLMCITLSVLVSDLVFTFLGERNKTLVFTFHVSLSLTMGEEEVQIIGLITISVRF